MRGGQGGFRRWGGGGCATGVGCIAGCAGMGGGVSVTHNWLWGCDGGAGWWVSGLVFFPAWQGGWGGGRVHGSGARLEGWRAW